MANAGRCDGKDGDDGAEKIELEIGDGRNADSEEQD